jgi:uncharacterized protein YndB with AHSA1/START domain
MRRSSPSMSAQVFVEAWPEEAFRTFVEEVGFGLRQAAIQPERGRYLRFNQDLGGRFVEVHDAVAATGVELGRVTAWEPGVHLAFGWRQPDWPEGVSTEVDVRFAPVFDGTLLSVEHAGFERLGLNRARGEYRVAWNEAVGWVARRARLAPSMHGGPRSPTGGHPIGGPRIHPRTVPSPDSRRAAKGRHSGRAKAAPARWGPATSPLPSRG